MKGKRRGRQKKRREDCIKEWAGMDSNSAVKVHDSQAYRNMEMTRECISFSFCLRDMLLSLPMGFSFVRAAVACAILERISGLEPSSETTQPLPFYFYLSLVATGAVCHQFGPLSTHLHLIPYAGFAETYY